MMMMMLRIDYDLDGHDGGANGARDLDDDDCGDDDDVEDR